MAWFCWRGRIHQVWVCPFGEQWFLTVIGLELGPMSREVYKYISTRYEESCYPLAGDPE